MGNLWQGRQEEKQVSNDMLKSMLILMLVFMLMVMFFLSCAVDDSVFLQTLEECAQTRCDSA